MARNVKRFNEPCVGCGTRVRGVTLDPEKSRPMCGSCAANVRATGDKLAPNRVEPLSPIDKRFVDGMLLYLRVAPIAERRTQPYVVEASKTLCELVDFDRSTAASKREEFERRLHYALMSAYLQGYRDHMEAPADPLERAIEP